MFCVCVLKSKVGVDFAPVGDGRHDAELDYFVAQGAEVLVALVKFFFLLRRTGHGFHGHTVFIHSGFHGHHDVAEAVVVHVGSHRPAECGAP